MTDQRVDDHTSQEPDHEPEPCPLCDGTGIFTDIGGGAGLHHSYHSPVECPDCHGTGLTDEPEKCGLCKGRGFEVMAGVVLGECGDCEGTGWKL